MIAGICLRGGILINLFNKIIKFLFQYVEVLLLLLGINYLIPAVFSIVFYSYCIIMFDYDIWIPMSLTKIDSNFLFLLLIVAVFAQGFAGSICIWLSFKWSNLKNGLSLRAISFVIAYVVVHLVGKTIHHIFGLRINEGGDRLEVFVVSAMLVVLIPLYLTFNRLLGRWLRKYIPSK